MHGRQGLLVEWGYPSCWVTGLRVLIDACSFQPVTHGKEVREIEKSIGIDIGKRKCVACVMEHDGVILEESSYDNTAKDALEFATSAKARYGTCRAVCESTGNHWIKTIDAFEHVGIPIALANPFKIKAIASASIKNDTIDARTLAHLLRSNLIPACHIGSAESRGIKQILRYQIRLVQDRTRAINFVHTLTDKYDVNPKDGGKNVWTKRVLAYLEEADVESPHDRFVLDRCIAKIRHYNDEIKKTGNEIRRYVRDAHGPKILMSITGMDAFSAALLAAEIDTIDRFGNPKKFVSWAGMCPTLHQSGDTSYHGRMKKDSNRKVNWVMVQCALVAVRHDPRMKEYYVRLMKRHRHNIAITHVANKMLTIIWHMLTEDNLYEDRNEKLYRAKIRQVMRA